MKGKNKEDYLIIIIIIDAPKANFESQCSNKAIVKVQTTVQKLHLDLPEILSGNGKVISFAHC